MNVQPQFQEKANIASLKKLDQSIIDIIASASHASMYRFEPSIVKWDNMNCEGPLFIVKRNDDVRFGLIIANRLSLENFVHGIDSSFHVELVEPYIIFKSNAFDNDQPVIRGIWLSDDKERSTIFGILSKCMKAQNVQQSQTVFQPSPLTQEETSPTKSQVDNNKSQQQQQVQQKQKQPKQQHQLQQQHQQHHPQPQSKTSTTQPTRAGPTNQDQGGKLLTPGMILGEKAVPKLGAPKKQELDMTLFKEALRELFDDEAFLLAVHARYSQALSRN